MKACVLSMQRRFYVLRVTGSAKSLSRFLKKRGRCPWGFFAVPLSFPGVLCILLYYLCMHVCVYVCVHNCFAKTCPSV